MKSWQVHVLSGELDHLRFIEEEAGEARCFNSAHIMIKLQPFTKVSVYPVWANHFPCGTSVDPRITL